MADNPHDILDLVRRALKAQIELGTDEIVLDHVERKAAAAVSPQVAEAVSPAVTTEPTLFATEETARMAKTVVRDDITIPLGDATFGSTEQHNAEICNCLKCPLGKTRTKFVYGVGNPKAKLLFIGEAPGAQEDLQGEPFVGAAGKLLDKILAAIQLSRQEVYIANILKCRPPNNRDPQPDEVAACLPYLHEQIRLIQPKLICCLGRIAVQSLLQTTTPLSKLRKSWLNYHGIPMLVTYHPAALLRFPEYKKETWEDMKMLKARYDQV